MLFKPVQNVDSDLMREIAESAGVEWDYQAVHYTGPYVGYADAPDDADRQTIINEADEFGIILRDDEPEQD